MFAGMMDRSEWMYQIDRVNDPRYLFELKLDLEREFHGCVLRERERMVVDLCCRVSIHGALDLGFHGGERNGVLEGLD